MAKRKKKSSFQQAKEDYFNEEVTWHNGFSIHKVVVKAKSRQLKATYAFEQVQDVEAYQGLDLEAELMQTLADEIQKEIDADIIKSFGHLFNNDSWEW